MSKILGQKLKMRWKRYDEQVCCKATDKRQTR